MQALQNQSLQNLYGAQQAQGDWRSGLQQQQMMGGAPQQFPAPQQLIPTLTTKKELSMFKAVASDVKSFILEHRSTLYFLAFALLIDHFLFQDAFRNRLKAIVDKLVKKVEDKVAAS
jgi:hypothetical protein